MRVDRTVLFRLATNERLERAIKRPPGGEAAAWRAASRYVAGNRRSDAIATARMLLELGHGVSVDLFGERVSDPVIADRVLEHDIGWRRSAPTGTASRPTWRSCA